MTTAEVMALRAELGWASPIKPLEPGAVPWCVSGRDGFNEFMVHPDDAFRFLAAGFPTDNGLCRCEAVGVWPLVNAIQLRVSDVAHTAGRPFPAVAL